jgi:glucosylceramidase
MKTARVSLFGLFFAIFAAACSPAGGGNTGTAGTTGSGGSVNCPTGQTACGTACVDTSSDSSNCGGCGTSCSGGQSCQASQCKCPAGLLDCGGSCVASDATHCGSCVNACSSGQVCSNNACTSSCGGGTTACGSACCTASQTCTNNACVDNPTTGTGGTGGSSGAAGSGGGTAGSAGGSAGSVGSGGRGGTAGSTAGSTGSGGRGGGTAGSGGTGGSATTPSSVLVTSASGAYWRMGSWTESTANATVTVNDTTMNQTWEGFGGAFNELGWTVLTSSAMQTQALNLLFSSTDGAGFTWGRIPMGASDYAVTRYTNVDMGEDPTPNSSGSTRPAADTGLTKFSISRDMMRLIPYIKAAQQVKPDIRFWASPWTTPVWMKTGYKTDNGSGGTAKKPSYYDGGTVTNTPANLAAYAQLYVKFVNAYKEQGINIEVVSPQNEPGYDQNYPSALWESATYVAWVKDHLGPAMAGMSPAVKVMLGTLSNAGDGGRNDINIATALLGDATAKSRVAMVGVQWGVLDRVNSGQTFMGLPVWATEHKCGNYPWNPSGYPAYNSTMAPNDQAYAVESWGYLRDAINKGKVTSYSAWNMVLDRVGLGNDTSRDWRQNALLAVNGTTITPTPAYYVFRHLAQYVVPGARVVGTSSADAVAFKNPDGSLVVTTYNSGGANANYVVAIGGKKFQFMMPGQGWATVKYKP